MNPQLSASRSNKPAKRSESIGWAVLRGALVAPFFVFSLLATAVQVFCAGWVGFVLPFTPSSFDFGIIGAWASLLVISVLLGAYPKITMRKVESPQGEPSFAVDAISRVSLWLMMLSCPGVFGIALFLLYAWFSTFMYTYLSGLPSFIGFLFCFTFLFLPISLTSHLALNMVYGADKVMLIDRRLYVRNRRIWQQCALSDVTRVEVRRRPSVKDAEYHEDDDGFHQLAIHFTDGEKNGVLPIDYSSFRGKSRERLLSWLGEVIPSRLLAPRARTLIEGEQEKKNEPEPVRVEGADHLSFTVNWDREMQAHIGRTNYVPLEPGHKLQNGRFTVSGYLNSGGFCTAYVALDGEKKVVLKESALPDNLSDAARAQVSEMFAREAKLLKRCEFPNIATIMDFFTENKREYLVLEHIEGAPLSELVRQGGAVNENQVRLWAKRLAGFLEYLHGLEPPIIHRDFTPDNILLHRNGDLYLIDFGAANEFIGQATGTLIGKQSYIAPEQLQGKAVPQSDIYAMGGTLYFLLTGNEPMPLSELHPLIDGYKCSSSMNDVIAACTRLDPSERVESASKLLSLLA